MKRKIRPRIKKIHRQQRKKIKRAVRTVEGRLEDTKLVQKIESKTGHLKIIQIVVHYTAIVLVPGYLLGTIIYHVYRWIKK